MPVGPTSPDKPRVGQDLDKRYQTRRGFLGNVAKGAAGFLLRRGVVPAAKITLPGVVVDEAFRRGNIPTSKKEAVNLKHIVVDTLHDASSATVSKLGDAKRAAIREVRSQIDNLVNPIRNLSSVQLLLLNPR